MSNPSLFARAAEPLLNLVHKIKPDQLAARTPDTEWDVRALVNHLLIWGPPMEGAGRKESVPPVPEDTDFTDGDWPALLTAQIERTVAAWGTPASWEGMTYMASPSELPAAAVGGMGLVEMLAHGWDLSRAIGQDVEWPDDVVAATYDVVAGMAEMGREEGVFGPEVVVPADAPMFDRMLGMTGRDPAWR